MEQENQKNLLLAIALSVAVLMAWQFFYAGPKMKAEQERRQRIEQEAKAKQQPGQPTTPGASQGSVPQPGAPAATGTPAGQVPQIGSGSREVALTSSPRVQLETPSLTGSIALRGARIDDLKLVKYRETVDPKSPSVTLLSPAGSSDAYFAEFGWTVGSGSTVKVPDHETVWTAPAGQKLTPEKPLVLTYDNGSGLVFTRTLSVDKDYLFTVKDDVRNTSSAPVTLFPYARVFRYGTPKVQGFFILHEGLIGVVGEKGLQEITYSDVLKDGGSKTFNDVKSPWLGFTDKYWATALIPSKETPYRVNFTGMQKSGANKESYQTDYLASEGVTIGAGETKSVEGRLFAGAKEVKVIDRYQEQLQAPKFDLMIDWGWFYFITRPLFKLIDWLYGLLGNFGLAILAVTVIVKAAFFWLANKSYESMSRMKKLQPEMERIRDRYKDDRARQQQELMELYRKEKINPAAGCLPVLVQIPVFFALYKVLFVTIDMRHAPFYGWIKDLSAADPTSLFNLFGLLPYQVPEFLHIGLWPILMGITMWIQMQLNPQQPDPMQQRIFNWMPVFFTFLLASFPAGLVIYWAWNNLLSLLQQYIIMRKNDVEVHLWKNMGLDKLASRFRKKP